MRQVSVNNFLFILPHKARILRSLRFEQQTPHCKSSLRGEVQALKSKAQVLIWLTKVSYVDDIDYEYLERLPNIMFSNHGICRYSTTISSNQYSPHHRIDSIRSEKKNTGGAVSPSAGWFCFGSCRGMVHRNGNRNENRNMNRTGSCEVV